MPELPEVEVTKMGIQSYCENSEVLSVDCFQQQLRWPVSAEVLGLHGRILAIQRRSKYLLFEFDSGWMVVHLGMSGRLSVHIGEYQVQKHDHLVFHLSQERKLIYHDPRRFGAVLWYSKSLKLEEIPIFSKLGLEPFDSRLTPRYLLQTLQSRKQRIKLVLLSNTVVVGVGNIYASEVLFMAKIHPNTPANQLDLEACTRLQKAIQAVLSQAIEMGGSTLKDFLNVDGTKGYFQTVNNVYGRAGEECKECETKIESYVLAQRNTFFCPSCQRVLNG